MASGYDSMGGYTFIALGGMVSRESDVAFLATMLTMLDFIDTKPFGAACIGAATMTTCYVAGMNDWHLIAPPLLVMSAYYLFFPKTLEMERGGRSDRSVR